MRYSGTAAPSAVADPVVRVQLGYERPGANSTWLSTKRKPDPAGAAEGTPRAHRQIRTMSRGVDSMLLDPSHISWRICVAAPLSDHMRLKGPRCVAGLARWPRA